MSEASEREAAELLASATRVLIRAEATLGGVGMACFATMKEQNDAFDAARAKRDAAKKIVAMATEFREKHAAFS